MNDAEHKRRSFKTRRAQRTELRADQAESGHEDWLRRPADDPGRRATRLRPSGSSRFRPRRGITRDRLEAQLAAQHSLDCSALNCRSMPAAPARSHRR